MKHGMMVSGALLSLSLAMGGCANGGEANSAAIASHEEAVTATEGATIDSSDTEHRQGDRRVSRARKRGKLRARFRRRMERAKRRLARCNTQRCRDRVVKHQGQLDGVMAEQLVAEGDAVVVENPLAFQEGTDFFVATEEATEGEEAAEVAQPFDLDGNAIAGDEMQAENDAFAEEMAALEGQADPEAVPGDGTDASVLKGGGGGRGGRGGGRGFRGGRGRGFRGGFRGRRGFRGFRGRFRGFRGFRGRFRGFRGCGDFRFRRHRCFGRGFRDFRGFRGRGFRGFRGGRRGFRGGFRGGRRGGFRGGFRGGRGGRGGRR
jgi:hypothetical protein